MSDAGEGLVDASSRLAERMEEMEENRRLAKANGPRVDPEKARALESLRLAKADIERQLAPETLPPARRTQLTSALNEVMRRQAELQQTA